MSLGGWLKGWIPIMARCPGPCNKKHSNLRCPSLSTRNFSGRGRKKWQKKLSSSSGNQCYQWWLPYFTFAPWKIQRNLGWFILYCNGKLSKKCMATKSKLQILWKISMWKKFTKLTLNTGRLNAEQQRKVSECTLFETFWSQMFLATLAIMGDC